MTRYMPITGFLLNVVITYSAPSNRNEKRQAAKTGMFRR